MRSMSRSAFFLGMSREGDEEAQQEAEAAAAKQQSTSESSPLSVSSHATQHQQHRSTLRLEALMKRQMWGWTEVWSGGGDALVGLPAAVLANPDTTVM
jgi:hypothetical protein